MMTSDTLQALNTAVRSDSESHCTLLQLHNSVETTKFKISLQHSTTTVFQHCLLDNRNEHIPCGNSTTTIPKGWN